MWEGVGDRTELQHTDPHSIGNNRILSCSPGLLNRGPGGPASLGHVLIPAPSPNWSGLQTNWLPVFTELYNSSIAHSISLEWHVQRPPSSCERHKLHSFNPSTVKATLCYSSTGCTCYLHRCILTARPGRRSIYNNYSIKTDIIRHYSLSNLTFVTKAEWFLSFCLSFPHIMASPVDIDV